MRHNESAAVWLTTQGKEGRGMAHRPTVLVVDDEEGIIELMQDFLDVDGFAVLAARDGAEALAGLARERVDCVLLDVMMPGASGFDICRRIRETADVPILFLSARDATVTATRSAACAWAVTTTSLSRPRPTRWWPGSTPCCAATGPQPWLLEPQM